MVRFVEAEAVQGSAASGNAVFCKYGFCVSTDEKPVDDSISTGSCLVEVDTMNVYFYNEATSEWIKA